MREQARLRKLRVFRVFARLDDRHTLAGILFMPRP
jgi:hypothetical protein